MNMPSASLLSKSAMTGKNLRSPECPIPSVYLDVIENYFGVSLDELLSNSRIRELVICRGWLAYSMNKDQGLSLKKIGLWMNRDHSTIIHLIRDYEDFVGNPKRRQEPISQANQTNRYEWVAGANKDLQHRFDQLSRRVGQSVVGAINRGGDYIFHASRSFEFGNEDMIGDLCTLRGYIYY